MSGFSFRQGDGVYSQDDQKVGSVATVEPGYIEMSTGFLGLGHHLFIPFDAVARFDDPERRVYLNVDKDSLSSRGWDQRPVAPEAVGEAANERECRVPAHEERADVEKVAHPGEEIDVQPERTAEQRPFADTMRREMPGIQVSGEPADLVRGEEQVTGLSETMRPSSEAMPTDQTTDQTAGQRDDAARGVIGQDVEPSNQFGSNAFNDPHIRDLDWASVEPDLRREWEARFPAIPWEGVRDRVASFWNQGRRTA